MRGPMKMVTDSDAEPLFVRDAYGHEWILVGSYAIEEVMRTKWICRRCRLGDVDDVAQHIREVAVEERCPREPLPGRDPRHRRVSPKERVHDQRVRAERAGRAAADELLTHVDWSRAQYAVHVDTGQWSDEQLREREEDGRPTLKEVCPDLRRGGRR